MLVIVKRADEYKPELIEVEDITLEFMQDTVGGYITPVQWADLTIWVDEEGDLKDLPENMDITVNGNRITLKGNMLFTGNGDEEGNIQGLDSDQVFGMFYAFITAQQEYEMKDVVQKIVDNGILDDIEAIICEEGEDDE